MNIASKEVSVRTVVWVLGTLAGLAIGSVSLGLYADDRYAKDVDIKQYIAEERVAAKQRLEEMKRATGVAASVVRKQMLEDRIFDLDLIPDTRKSDVQRAMANRSKTQLQEVQAQLNAAPKNDRAP